MSIKNLEERIKAAFKEVSTKERIRNGRLDRKEKQISRVLEELKRRLGGQKLSGA